MSNILESFGCVLSTDIEQNFLSTSVDVLAMLYSKRNKVWMLGEGE